MQFGNLENFWLFILLPLLAAILYSCFRSKEKDLNRLASTAVLTEIYTSKEDRLQRAYRHSYLLLLSVLFMLIAALRPQWGFSWQEGQKKGLDIVVAFDVSESMLAEDVAPSRLERAKREIYDLLEALKGDRIGLVAFAGYAFTEVPLTEDYSTFRLFLQMLNKDIIPVPGTNVGKAIDKSLATFQLSNKTTTAKRERAILLITDGEDLEGNWGDASKKAKELGVQIYVMGVGTAVGSPIPTDKGYKKDKNGSVVVTRLNEQVLRDMAEQTGGTYVLSIATAEDTTLLYAKGIRSSLDPQAYNQARLKKWGEYFQLPLALAFLLFAWPAFRLFAERLMRRNPSTLNILVLLMLCGLCLLFSSTAQAQDAEKLGHEGKLAYEQGNYEKAKNDYTLAREQENADYRFSTGLGAAYYRSGDFENALKYFSEAVTKSQNDKIKAQSRYNLGNAKVQLNLLDEAIKDYEESLKLVPQEQVVIDNLAYARRLLEQQKKEQQKENQSSSQDQSSSAEQSSSAASSEQENNSNDNSNSNSSNNSSDQSQQQEQNQSSTSQSSQSNSEQQSSQDSSTSDNKDNNQQSENSSASSSRQNNQEDKQSSAASSSSKSAAGAQDKERPTASSSSSSPLPDNQRQDKAILDSVAENRALFNNYRQNKALQELQSTDQPLPEKDW